MVKWIIPPNEVQALDFRSHRTLLCLGVSRCLVEHVHNLPADVGTENEAQKKSQQRQKHENKTTTKRTSSTLERLLVSFIQAMYKMHSHILTGLSTIPSHRLDPSAEPCITMFWEMRSTSIQVLRKRWLSCGLPASSGGRSKGNLPSNSHTTTAGINQINTCAVCFRMLTVYTCVGIPCFFDGFSKEQREPCSPSGRCTWLQHAVCNPLLSDFDAKALPR